MSHNTNNSDTIAAMTEALLGGGNWDEHGFYIEEDNTVTPTPTQQREEGEVENDHYFEMRNEIRGWE